MGRPAKNSHFIDLLKAMEVHDCMWVPNNTQSQREKRNSLVAVERVTGFKFRSIAHETDFYVIRVA